MNHTDSLGAKQLFTPLRFRCQQVFFHFAKVFFAAPSGQLVGAEETYVSFSNPRQELFCHPGKFLFRRPFGRGQLIGANGFMRLFDPTVKHFSAKKFMGLPSADCLFNQYTEKTNKFAYIFFLRTAMRLPQRLLPQARISSIISFEEKYFLLSFPSFLQLAGACPDRAPPGAVPSQKKTTGHQLFPAGRDASWLPGIRQGNGLPSSAVFMILVTIHA